MFSLPLTRARAAPVPHFIPHLDGLRALALAGVLLFHFRVSPFRGGFAGVDIFLTLSGFLITRNITRQLSARTFSLRGFYASRFFRLYGASAATTFAVVLAAYLLFSNELAGDACASAIASMLFGSNVYFHAKHRYFDTAAVFKPLLHTWSLSLEEQFYLLWPPLILLSLRLAADPYHTQARAQARLRTVMTVLTAASLAFAARVHAMHPSLAFYELPARVFQFGVGALLALHPGDSGGYGAVEDSDYNGKDGGEAVREAADGSPLRKLSARMAWRQFLRECGAVLALAAVLLTFVLLPEGASPLKMLPLTVATAALIALPDTSVATRLLSHPALRVVGRYSYAAYLVHWPVFVFGRYVLLAMRANADVPVVYAAVTSVLAIALKHTVEDRVRFGGARTRVAFGAFAAGTAMFAAYGVASGGFASRPQKVVTNMELKGSIRHICHEQDTATAAPFVEMGYHICHTGDVANGTRSDRVFFGNSFTSHLVPALHVIGLRRREFYVVHYRKACGMTPTAMMYSARPICHAPWKMFWAQARKLARGATMVVSNEWSFRTPEQQEETLREMEREVGAVRRALKLVVVGEPPGVDPDENERFYGCRALVALPVGNLLTRLGLFGARADIDARCALPREGAPPTSRRVWQHEKYMELFGVTNATTRFVDMYGALCTGEGEGVRCKQPIGGRQGQRETGYNLDGRHLSKRGAENLSELLEAQLFDNR